MQHKKKNFLVWLYIVFVYIGAVLILPQQIFLIEKVFCPSRFF